MIPDIIDGVRVRKGDDGSFTLPRAKRETVAQLDKDYIRIKPLHWRPYPEITAELSDLQSRCKNGIAGIVGKGPTLDYLTATHFDNDDLVICLNESIHKIESLEPDCKLYMLQQDRGLGLACLPKYATAIVSGRASKLYKDIRNTIIYVPEQFGCDQVTLSVIVAIQMIQAYGIKEIRLYGFDACVESNLEYAKCIGHPASKGGSKQRFLCHRKLIDETLKVPATWIIERDPEILIHDRDLL